MMKNLARAHKGRSRTNLSENGLVYVDTQIIFFFLYIYTRGEGGSLKGQSGHGGFGGVACYEKISEGWWLMEGRTLRPDPPGLRGGLVRGFRPAGLTSLHFYINCEISECRSEKGKESEAMDSYQEYLQKKAQSGADHGFEPVFMPDMAFDFQEHLIDWSVRKGRGAIFADCGLGKTLMELSWAENVRRKTGGNVLIGTCLAVAEQMVQEAEKFGIAASRSSDGVAMPGLTITNYERLHLFNPQDFAGVVCDESSILKNFKGTRKTEITSFMRKRPYRLLATATAAPNDFIELGTSSEALGYLGYMDMLNKFFKNDLNNSASGRMRGEVIKWRLKGHAELPFWRFVCSWARACRKPSDLGFDDGRFDLPPLIQRQHVVRARTSPDGMLFSLPAHGLQEQREERRRTLQERCERAAEIANSTSDPVIVWCHLNDEGDLLEKLIPDAVQVKGSDSDEKKEDRLLGFPQGRYSVLITKPKIGAFGLNYQHCNRVVYFPSHSFEQYYQSLRRCWRFGQKRQVEVDIVTSEGEADILSNLQRKSSQAEEMFANLIAEMNNAMGVARKEETGVLSAPSWLKGV